MSYSPLAGLGAAVYVKNMQMCTAYQEDFDCKEDMKTCTCVCNGKAAYLGTVGGRYP